MRSIPRLETIALCVLVAAIVSPAVCAAQGAPQTRVEDGLVALYSANSVSDDGVIRDLAETVQRLDLHIQPGPPPAVCTKDAAVQFGPSPELVSPGVFSDRPATSLIEQLKGTGQITVEAWVSAANADQAGPARIVSISSDATSRNMTLGQDGSRFVFRLRTSEMSEQGTPPIRTPENMVRPGQLQHLAVTFDGHSAIFYIDGQPVSKTTHFGGDMGIGTLQNWDESMHLMLGNEFTGGRFWCGSITLMAIYCDALSPAQVQANFAAGPELQNQD